MKKVIYSSIVVFLICGLYNLYTNSKIKMYKLYTINQEIDSLDKDWYSNNQIFDKYYIRHNRNYDIYKKHKDSLYNILITLDKNYYPLKKYYLGNFFYITGMSLDPYYPKSLNND